MNKIIISGRLTKDSEINYTKRGKSVGLFTVAVDRPYQKDRPDGARSADYFYCKMFKSSSEKLVPYLSKGKAVTVEGRMCIENYQKDNQYKSAVYVVVENLEFQQGNAKGNNTGTELAPLTPAETMFGTEVNQDDIPY